MIRTVVSGIGTYLPERVVTNAELAQLMETSDEWIVERTGIRERRWVSEEMGGSDMAAHAARRALEDAGMAKEEVDCIVLATLSPDHCFPGTACFLQRKLELPGIPAIDIRNQCSGFLYGLSIADAFIKSGQHRTVMLVGAEVHSTGLDRTTRGRDVACLFGDGAGVLILKACEDGERGVYATRLHADGRHAESLWIEAPASRCFPDRLTIQMVEEGRHFPKMQGRNVFMAAIRNMPEVIHETLAASGHTLDQVDLFVPHQANQRITEGVAKQLGIAEHKVVSNIERLGNTTAASIPLALHDARSEGRLHPGDLVLLASFGAGFTWAAAVLRW